jgi:hypothetical protein
MRIAARGSDPHRACRDTYSLDAGVVDAAGIEDEATVFLPVLRRSAG